MKLALLAAALNAAVALASEISVKASPTAADGAMAKLRGAAVASDSPEDAPTWDGIPDFLQKPDYCDGGSKYEDCDCYKEKNGCVPKCCFKNKGSCPSGHMPDCDNKNCKDCEPPKYPGGGDNSRDDGCFNDDDCGSGDFCKFNVANCGNQGAGRCETVPSEQACTMNIQYVCGCNGRTYSNECEADSAGVSIKHFGECPIVECNNDNNCNNGEFCQFNVGNCGAQGKPGICMVIPGQQACNMQYLPVCGCDGNTYSNDCQAQSMGVSVKYYGECETTSCWSDGDCNSKEYCLFEQGHCGMSNQEGLCVETPQSSTCTMNYHPVCGCNGQTYSNSCECAAAGKSIMYWGEC